MPNLNQIRQSGSSDFKEEVARQVAEKSDLLMPWELPQPGLDGTQDSFLLSVSLCLSPSELL